METNRLRKLTFVAASIALTAAAQVCVQPPAGMVSWWPGDGNANDIAAGGNHGILQFGATFAAGQVGQAFSLDGVDDRVLIPDSPNLNFSPTSPVTVDAWVFRAGTKPTMHILGKRVGCGFIHYQLAFDAGGLCFGGDSGAACFLGFSPPLNTWTHVAGTFDGSMFKIYVNGQLAGAGTGTLGPANTEPLEIGDSGTCSIFGVNWQGLIDEVEIYDRALSEAEISALFAAGSAGKCKADNAIPFSAFTAQVEVEGLLANAEFEVRGRFTLGAGGTLNPLADVVTLQFANVSVTIPSGSFQFDPSKGEFKFEGTLGGLAIEARLTPLGGSWSYKVEGEDANLTGIPNTVTVSLKAGRNRGTASAAVAFEP